MKRWVISMLILLIASFGFIPTFAGEEEKKSTKSLHEAAMAGDVEQVQLFISGGTDVNARDMTGYTPLFYAAQNGQKKAAELLIGAGANVSARDGYGNTPLHYAAIRGHYDVCEVLISNGADVGTRNLTGGTALAMAKAQGHNRIAELLGKQAAKGGTVTRTEDRISRLRPRPEGPNLYPDYEYEVQRETRGIAESTAEVDILADPNEIKARVKAFEGLEKALEEVASKSKNEEHAWLQRRIDNRINLAKTVQDQVKEELGFIRKVAVEEKAEKTTKAIDVLLSSRQERSGKVVKRLQEQRRAERRAWAQAMPGRGRGRYPRRSARRRSPQAGRFRERPPREETAGPVGGRGVVMSRTGEPEDLRKASEVIDQETENHIREWLQTKVDDRIKLAQTVHKQVRTELTSTRKIAVEEEAKKTTAAIDGVLLSRQVRFEKIVKKMEERTRNLRQMRDLRGRGRGRNYDPRQMYPQNMRNRGRLPQQDPRQQEGVMEEEDLDRNRPRRP